MKRIINVDYDMVLCGYQIGMTNEQINQMVLDILEKMDYSVNDSWAEENLEDIRTIVRKHLRRVVKQQ